MSETIAFALISVVGMIIAALLLVAHARGDVAKALDKKEETP